jgi:hypothetical protein
MSELKAFVQEERGPRTSVTLSNSVGGLEYLRATKMAIVTLIPGHTNDFAFNWQNPETVPIIVWLAVLRLTAAGGAATMDIGTGAAADTLSSNLIDGCSIAAAVPTYFNNVNDPGGNGKAIQYMDAKGGATDWICGRILGADSLALAGTFYIFYTPLA